MKIFFYLSLLIFINLPSQVPGYMGKRFSIIMGYCIGAPTVKLPANTESVPLRINNDGPYLRYKINSSAYYNFKVNYVIAEKNELELSIRNTNLGITQVFYYKYFPSSTYYNSAIYNVINLHYTAIGISVKKTMKGIISPLGKYLLAGISYNMAKTTDPNLAYKQVGLTFAPITAGFFDLHLGMGINYLLWNRLILNFALDSYINDYIFTLARSGGELSIEDNKNDFTEKKIIKGRIFSSNFITASAGLGLLIF